MSYTIVSLGNTGSEYVNTRHNTGRIVLGHFYKKYVNSEWKNDKKRNALVAGADVEGKKVLLIMPETMMNRSGKALLDFIGSKTKMGKLIVIHDDMDLPIGSVKVSFGRGSGGHRGVESIIKSIRSKDFIRIRVGISKEMGTKKIKKPKGEKNIINFILGEFKEKELSIIKKMGKTVTEIIEAIILDGIDIAMNDFN